LSKFRWHQQNKNLQASNWFLIEPIPLNLNLLPQPKIHQ
jgi:hypothetical protein